MQILCLTHHQVCSVCLAVQLYGDVYFGSIFALNIFEIKKIKIKYGQSKNTKFPFRAIE
jgi:hypothetical protein